MIKEHSDGVFSAERIDLPAEVQGVYRLALCCTTCSFRIPIPRYKRAQPDCCPDCGSLTFTSEVGRWTFKLWMNQKKDKDDLHSFLGEIFVDRVRFTKKSEENENR